MIKELANSILVIVNDKVPRVPKLKRGRSSMRMTGRVALAQIALMHS